MKTNRTVVGVDTERRVFHLQSLGPATARHRQGRTQARTRTALPLPRHLPGSPTKRVEQTIKIVHIHQSGTERHLLTVTVGMNEQGECTLKQNGEELLPCQVRRRVLEETFFG